MHWRQDLKFVDIRGNIPTRLRKLEEGHCESMILAAAGLLRLGLANKITQYLSTNLMMPAVGQGAIAIECRTEDIAILNLCRSINHQITHAQITAERAFLDHFGGGCSVPIGALATTNDNNVLSLAACITSLDGKQVVKGERSGSLEQAEHIGIMLAKELLAKGADNILQELRASSPNPISAP
jgi:hydroxymethylbilane synthase